MRTLQRQRGLSAIGWLFLLAIIAGTVLVALKLIPVYLENLSVASVLEDMGQSADAYSTRQEVRQNILRRFNINNIDQVDRESIVITRQRDSFNVLIDYEVRVPFLYNIDFLLTFDNRAEVPAG